MHALCPGSNFPVVVNTVQFPLGESIIKVVGYTADAGEELLLGKASVVIPGMVIEDNLCYNI